MGGSKKKCILHIAIKGTLTQAFYIEQFYLIKHFWHTELLLDRPCSWVASKANQPGQYDRIACTMLDD